jgi:hypothetical protein
MTGRLTLPSGREVVDTGKVLIGIRSGERGTSMRPLSRDALRLQGLLLGAGGAMHPDNYRSINRLIDDDVVANRSRFDEECVPVLRMAPLRRPSLIPLDGSVLGRFARWLRNLSLKGPKL